MKPWSDSILSTFRRESTERLEHLDTLLVSLERAPEDDCVFSDVAGEIHTLKGSAKMLGVPHMGDLAHRVEDVLAAMSDGRLTPAPAVFTAFLEAMDVIRDLVEAFADRKEATVDCGPLQRKLDELGKTGTPDVDAQPADETPSATQGELAQVALQEGTQPRSDATAPTKTAQASAEVSPTIEAEARLGEPAVRAPPVTLSGHARRRADTIRTEITKLDTIMNLVGEAAIRHIKSEGHLRQAADFVREIEGALKLAQGMREEILAVPDGAACTWGEQVATMSADLAAGLKNLRTALRGFRVQFDTDSLENKLLLDALQQEVAEIRMLPVATLFARFPRAARDLASEHGKLVDIEIRGGDTRIDQKVLENIEAPLVHLIRNAVDHGIESPAERRAQGKPERGCIRMTALREGGHIAITVADDGNGLDPAKLKETAVRSGILSVTEAEGLSDREAPYLICVKGFSTAPTVTEVSGRGVGMDVVKRMIEECKGELLIDSTLGQGTRFKIALPLTLAVTQALMVEVGGQRYCIPTLSIEMVRLVAPEEVQQVADRPVIKVGRRSVPLVKLADVLQVPGAEEVTRHSTTPVVFLAHARQRIAFAVDRLLAEQQIVIKSFGKVLRNVANVAGATILGTGEVAVILHTPDLVRYGLAHTGKTVPLALPGRGPAAPVGDRHILVVEDAMSTREMERDILEAAGLSVDTAVNGLDALEKSRSKRYGLFLVDVQMPVMGGFELVEALRSSDDYARTPIVFITSLASEA
ncbi:MAG: hypothetical protein DRI90_10915, partial [Deltaproteobacteria bacterium]